MISTVHQLPVRQIGTPILLAVVVGVVAFTVISLQNQQVGTTLGPLTVTITGDRARVAFTLAASGGAGGWMPDRAQVYDVETGWRTGGRDWKLISATWKPKL